MTDGIDADNDADEKQKTENETKRAREQPYDGRRSKKPRSNTNPEDQPRVADDEEQRGKDHIEEDLADFIDGASGDKDNNSDGGENSIADSGDGSDREDNGSASTAAQKAGSTFTKQSFNFAETSDALRDKKAPKVGQPDDGKDDATAQETVDCWRNEDDAAFHGETVDAEEEARLLAEAREKWQLYRQRSDAHSVMLCEQLRLVLEPTLATRLQGDYRTGKRINMRRVISYVSSGFRKDKIWLRRTKPAKREYQVLMMIDDSSSMAAAGPLALEAMATIANALTRLEVGDMCVASFADNVRVLHPFGTPFTDECGAKIIGKFSFDAQRTMLADSLERMLPVFGDAKSSASSVGSSVSDAVVLQLCFVISDARIDSDNRERLEHIIRELSERHILVVLVIIDRNENPKDSIFNTRTVSFRGNQVVTSSYFDEFPFPYYVAIQQLDALPAVLADALKQWFELIRVQLSTNN
jgi:midasin